MGVIQCHGADNTVAGGRRGPFPETRRGHTLCPSLRRLAGAALPLFPPARVAARTNVTSETPQKPATPTLHSTPNPRLTANTALPLVLAGGALRRGHDASLRARRGLRRCTQRPCEPCAHEQPAAVAQAPRVVVRGGHHVALDLGHRLPAWLIWRGVAAPLGCWQGHQPSATSARRNHALARPIPARWRQSRAFPLAWGGLQLLHHHITTRETAVSEPPAASRHP